MITQLGYLQCVELPGELVAATIRNAGLSIYDDLGSRPGLLYDIETLESRLDAGLRGLNLEYPIRTRAKVAKEAVAEVLGYPVPSSFRKTQPRFPGQNLDVFVQAANNLQIWNEEVDPGRRYGLIRVGANHHVTAVRVLTGEAIALLDRTGTLTSKYQAKRRPGRDGSALVTPIDTGPMLAALNPRDKVDPRVLAEMASTKRPEPAAVLSIEALYRELRELEGVVIKDPGLIQERGRGIAFQRLVCERLGLGDYGDVGQFPDVLSQALEVKLQLSPTVDLGLVSPDSEAPAQEVGHGLRHCDIRYAIAYASRIDDEDLRIDSVVLVAGSAFFEEFQRFEGNVTNQKLQIPLPSGLFETE